MNSNVREMLESMFDLFTEKFADMVEAWDHFVEFLAVDNHGSLICQLDHKFEWLFEDRKLCEALMKIYDPELMRSDYYDHLGDMYWEEVLGKGNAARGRSFLISWREAQSTAAKHTAETDETLRILDPVAGTGRLLMATHKRAPNTLLFGVDVDLRALRIALTNFAIHGITGYLLHANTLQHQIDPSTEDGRANWQYSNRWNSGIDELIPLETGNQVNQNIVLT